MSDSSRFFPKTGKKILFLILTRQIFLYPSPHNLRDILFNYRHSKLAFNKYKIYMKQKPPANPQNLNIHFAKLRFT
jgi:hypothetical protein